MSASSKRQPRASNEPTEEAPSKAGVDSKREATSIQGPLYAVLGLCVAGLVDMAYLTRLHWSVRSIPGYSSFCAISQEVNCDAVAASPYSMLLGVPVSFWGVLAYLALIAVAIWAIFSERNRTAHRGAGLGLLAAAAVGSLLVSAALGYISAVHIESFCVLCMAGYVINLGIAGAIGVALYMLRSNPAQAFASDLGFLLRRPGLVAATGVAALVIGAATLLLYPSPELKAEERAEGETRGQVTRTSHGTSGQAGGRLSPASEQAPFKGNTEATVTIVEFTDYECAFCKRSHHQIAELLAPYEGRYRIMHRHYPLDQACNPAIPRPFNQNSCAASRYAICAQEQDKFWEINTLFFSSRAPLQVPVLRQLAEQAGCDMSALDACLAGEEVDRVLARDIQDGIALGVRGTPTFFINGETIVGLPTPAALDRIFSQD